MWAYEDDDNDHDDDHDHDDHENQSYGLGLGPCGAAAERYKWAGEGMWAHEGDGDDHVLFDMNQINVLVKIQGGRLFAKYSWRGAAG